MFVNEQLNEGEWRSVDSERNLVLERGKYEWDYSHFWHFKIRYPEFSLGFLARNDGRRLADGRVSVVWTIAGVSAPMDLMHRRDEVMAVITDAMKAYGDNFRAVDDDLFSISFKSVWFPENQAERLSKRMLSAQALIQRDGYHFINERIDCHRTRIVDLNYGIEFTPKRTDNDASLWMFLLRTPDYTLTFEGKVVSQLRPTYKFHLYYTIFNLKGLDGVVIEKCDLISMIREAVKLDVSNHYSSKLGALNIRFKNIEFNQGWWGNFCDALAGMRSWPEKSGLYGWGVLSLLSRMR